MRNSAWVFLGFLFSLFVAPIGSAQPCPLAIATQGHVAVSQPLVKKAGVLSAVSSLPGPYGIGDFGSAKEFVRWLAQSGQSAWQILPLNPTDSAQSPFSSGSSFALDVAYLDLEHLIGLGLITRNDLPFRDLAEGPARYADARKMRIEVLRRAKRTFDRSPPGNLLQKLDDFRTENRFWLEVHAEHQVLSETHGYDFTQWPQIYRDRRILSHTDIRMRHSARLAEVEFEQFLLDLQWKEVRDLARQKGIQIIGDLPLYVSRFSADVWANPEAFQLDCTRAPLNVSGYPPCPTYTTGQLWGTPLYDWASLERTGFAFWKNRVRRALALTDVIRLDHFLGLYHHYSIDGNAVDASAGKWLPSKGDELLASLQTEFGSVPLIAEDLGSSIPPEVHDMRRKFSIPGMRILQFGYSATGGDPYHQVGAYTADSVAYPGNHDLPTLEQWRRADTEAQKRTREEWLQLLYDSNVPLVIVPLQDVLGLGEEARMNLPGTWNGATDPALHRENWIWRSTETQLSGTVSSQLKQWASASHRAP
jgi:4-alpha-glucanotransferase